MKIYNVVFWLCLAANSAMPREFSHFDLPTGILTLSTAVENGWEVRELCFDDGKLPRQRIFFEYEHPELLPQYQSSGRRHFFGPGINEIASAVVEEGKLAVIIGNGSITVTLVRTDLSAPEKPVEFALIRRMDASELYPLPPIKLIDPYHMEGTMRNGVKKKLVWEKNGNVYMEGELVGCSVGKTGKANENADDARRIEPRKESGRINESTKPKGAEALAILGEPRLSRAQSVEWLPWAALVALLAAITAWVLCRLRKNGK